MEPEIGIIVVLVAAFGWAIYKGLDGDGIVVCFVLSLILAGLGCLINTTSVQPKLMASRPAVIVQEFDSPNGHHFFYIDDDGAYKEQSFTDFKDVSRIKNGSKLKINYYFGKVYWGPDKQEVRAELE